MAGSIKRWKIVLKGCVVTDTTREFPTPQINVSFSQPGVHFVGIYSAWNGECKYTRDPPLHVIVGIILTCVGSTYVVV